MWPLLEVIALSIVINALGSMTSATVVPMRDL